MAERERAAAERRRASQLEQRRKEDQATIERRPILGRVAVAVRGRVDRPPSPTVAPGPWEKGAQAEEALGARLATLAESGFPVLHDRRKPGTNWNLDHLLVTSAGVWVIDSKHYKGQLERRATGTILRPRSDLYVGGRRRTALVEAMAWQVDVVSEAAGDLLVGSGVRIRPVLCFVGVTLPVWQRPFRIGEVLVTWPSALVRAVCDTSGPLTSDDRGAIATRLADVLPPGT